MGVRIWHWLKPELTHNAGTQWVALWWGAPIMMPLWIVALLMLLWMWKRTVQPLPIHHIKRNGGRRDTLRRRTAHHKHMSEFMLPTRRYARSLIILVCLGCTGATLLGRLFFPSSAIRQYPTSQAALLYCGHGQQRPAGQNCCVGDVHMWPTVAACTLLTSTTSLGHLDDLADLINVHNVDTLVLGAQDSLVHR